MPEKDYYKVLGVESDAKQDDIRKAYRHMAKKHHPDRHGGSKAAEEKFKPIADAWSVLGDADKRKEYDALQRARAHGGPAGGFSFEDMFQQGGGFGGGASGGAQQAGFGDLFSRFFGGGGRSRAPHAPRQRGGDLISTITVPFETSVHGGDIHVNVPREKSCKSCSGSGAAKGSSVDMCPECGGAGQVQAGQGAFSVARPCSTCLGRGKIIQKPCTTCNGSGTVEKPSRVKVAIPKGIEDGKKMRLGGMGRPGSGGAPAGDLLLEVHVAPHPFYTRKGRDIHSKVSVGMADAALGTSVDAQTLHGAVTLKVPAGTQPGRKMRVTGYGLQLPDGSKGDHIVEVQVVIPSNLNEEQRRLLERLRRFPVD